MNSFPLAAIAAPCSITPIRLGIAAALLAVAAPAQAWLRAQPPVHPVYLRGHCMVFDAARDTTMLFSGLTVGMPSDTWTWNGSNWALRQPIAAPSGRLDSAMVYDSARQRVVLHGGTGHNAEYLSDTWEWDGFNWLQISPLHTLGPRCSFAMAYDQARAQTVLFGGRANDKDPIRMKPRGCSKYANGSSRLCPGRIPLDEAAGKRLWELVPGRPRKSMSPPQGEAPGERESGGHASTRRVPKRPPRGVFGGPDVGWSFTVHPATTSAVR